MRLILFNWRCICFIFLMHFLDAYRRWFQVDSKLNEVNPLWLWCIYELSLWIGFDWVFFQLSLNTATGGARLAQLARDIRLSLKFYFQFKAGNWRSMYRKLFCIRRQAANRWFTTEFDHRTWNDYRFGGVVGLTFHWRDKRCSEPFRSGAIQSAFRQFPLLNWHRTQFIIGCNQTVTVRRQSETAMRFN